MRTIAACVASWLALSLLALLTLRFSWLGLLSSALTVAVLYIAAKAMDARGWSLFRLLALLYAGIGVINIQFESLIFKIMPPLEILRVTATGLAEVISVSAVLAWAITRDDPRPTSRHPLIGWLWVRLPVIGLAYIVLFMAAGSLIWPLVRQFYVTSGMLTFPSIGVIAATEFVRGLVYAIAMIPLLRRMEGRRVQAGFVAALALSVLGGIAPLLLPVDDIFPLEIRRIHMLEILGSSIAFGAIAAVLLVRRAPSMRADGVVAPA